MTGSELSPDALRDLFQAAEIQLGAGNLAAAGTLYTALLAHRPDDPDLLHRLGILAAKRGDPDRAIALMRQALERRPDAWDCRRNLAMTLERKGHRTEAATEFGALAAFCSAAGRLDDARAAYERALGLDEDNPAWLAGIGQIAGRQGRAAEAVVFLKRALELCPTDSGYATDLGAGLLEHRHPGEALAALRRAILLDPANGPAWSNFGVATERAGQAETDEARYDIAMAAFDRALVLAPDLMTARCNRGLALLRAGRFEEGWPEYEAGNPPLPSPPLPQWRGEAPETVNGPILLLSEQGHGDTLQFCRYALELAEAGHEVELLAQTGLRDFLARAMSHPRLRILNEGDQTHAVAVAPLMKLPSRMRSGAAIPRAEGCMSADPALVAAWRERLAPAAGERLVGLCWAGNPQHVMDRMRSASLSDLAPLGGVPGVRFVSLQVGYRAADPAPAGLELTRFTHDEMVPLEKLAALTAALDLIVTVDSMPLHLAGVLGVPAWGMIAKACDSRWMIGRSDSPWYARTRLFRQSTYGDWAGVVRSMAAALQPGGGEG